MIDDDDEVRRTLVRMLESAGNEVHQAADGETGISVCNEVEPELVISDILMPEKEGIETIRDLKRSHPTLKIIAISGGGQSGSMDFLEMARALGADEALQKPFRRAELLDAIQRLLGT